MSRFFKHVFSCPQRAVLQEGQCAVPAPSGGQALVRGGAPRHHRHLPLQLCGGHDLYRGGPVGSHAGRGSGPGQVQLHGPVQCGAEHAEGELLLLLLLLLLSEDCF